MTVLGYLPRENRVILLDRSLSLITYSLLSDVVKFQTLVASGREAEAMLVLPRIPLARQPKLSKFLEARGQFELALRVSRDPFERFDYALQSRKLDTARGILLALSAAGPGLGLSASDAELRWRQLGDAALAHGFNLPLAQLCFSRGNDYRSLLLLYSSLGHREGMLWLGSHAAATAPNIAFIALLLIGDVARCSALLLSLDRGAEAAALVRAYKPSALAETVRQWREIAPELVAPSIAAPEESPELFPDLALAAQVETYWTQSGRYPAPCTVAASDYLAARYVL